MVRRSNSMHEIKLTIDGKEVQLTEGQAKVLTEALEKKRSPRRPLIRLNQTRLFGLAAH